MDLTIFTEPQQGADYDDLLRVARCTEDAGFDGFFRSDHYRAMGPVSGEPGPTDAWSTWPHWPARPPGSGSARCSHR